MQIIPGITVFLNDSHDAGERIQLSAGSVPAPPSNQRWRYEDDARVPAPPWRKPQQDEQQILLAREKPENLGTAISVVRLPDSLLRAFAGIRDLARRGSDPEAITLTLHRPGYMAGIEAIKAYLAQNYQCRAPETPAEPIEGGIIIKASCLPTVTEDPNTRILVGLHLDDWYHLPLERRGESPNRVCINLGNEDRFLLFLNLPIARLSDIVSAAGAADPHFDLPGTWIARTFLKFYPTYPVCRLRIKPGEAYIAPTENTVHDASSIEMSGPDISLSLRGRFELASHGPESL